MTGYRLYEIAPKTAVVFLIFMFGLTALTPINASAQDLPGEVYALNGHVLDQDEMPLKEATVVLMDDESPETLDKTSTDSAGAYEFSGVAAGNYVIAASHACCESNRVAVVVGGANLQTTAPDLVLQARPPPQSGDVVVLSGRTVDRTTQDPVPLVSLSIENSFYSSPDCPPDMACPAYVESGYQYFEVTTDEDGSFSVEINRGSAYVRAYKEGYDVTVGRLEVSEDTQVDIPMQASDDAAKARIFGVLRDDAGRPIAGGSVSSYPDYKYQYECPPDADCVAPAEPYPRGGGGGTSDGTWYFESQNQYQYNSVTTESDGSWEMDIAPGPIIVQGWATDHLEASRSVEAQDGKSTSVDLVLPRIPPDSVKLSGTVTDRDTGDPIAFADLNIENQQWGDWKYVQTDEDGRFDILVKPGYTILTVNAYLYYNGCAYASMESDARGDDPESGGGEGGEPGIMAPEPGPQPGPCQSGERDQEYLSAVRAFMAEENGDVALDVELRPRPTPTSTFEGYVLNGSTGNAVEGAEVTFFNEITRDWGSARTDEFGSYEILVHAGYYTIRIWAPDFFDGVANEEIDVDEERRVDFELTPGQKRYGGGWYGGGRVMMDSEAYGPGGAPPPPSMASPGAPDESAPTPTEGEKVYEGKGGELGPYKPVSDDEEKGGKASGLSVVLVVAAAAGMVVLLRRRE